MDIFFQFYNLQQINVDVPKSSIMVGCKGSASASTISTLTNEVKARGLRGMIVWFATVREGFTYEPSWDTSNYVNSQGAFINALKNLK